MENSFIRVTPIIAETEAHSRLLYSSHYESYCLKELEVSAMYVNDGKVAGASFWGVEKAANNTFHPHHIHFTDDEPLKPGDWYFNRFIQQVRNNSGKSSVEWCHVNSPRYRRIVASTDHLFLTPGEFESVIPIVPKIPFSFIEEWIKSGGDIKEVKIETEIDYDEHDELAGSPIEAWTIIKTDMYETVTIL